MLKFTPAALLVSTLLLTSFAHADEQNRSLPTFKTIKSKSAFTLVVEVGKAQSVVIKGDEKFISRVSTEVFGDELVLSMKGSNTINISDAAQVVITLPELSKLRMEGAGKTSINNVSGPRLDLSYEGAGMLTANGKVKILNLKAQGVGLVDTKNLIAEQADVNLEGVGAVKVYASERLVAKVQGVGSLNYYGNPRNISKSVEGIGSMHAGD